MARAPIARISSRFGGLLPTTLLAARAVALVPRDTTVRPTTIWGMPRSRARTVAPATNSSPPTNNGTIPARISTRGGCASAAGIPAWGSAPAEQLLPGERSLGTGVVGRPADRAGQGRRVAGGMGSAGVGDGDRRKGTGGHGMNSGRIWMTHRCRQRNCSGSTRDRLNRSQEAQGNDGVLDRLARETPPASAECDHPTAQVEGRASRRPNRHR